MQQCGMKQSREQAAHQAFRTAIDLHRKGRLDEAARHYAMALQHHPSHFDALNNLGTIRAQRADTADEAVSLFRRAIQINPRVADSHNNLANVLRLLHQYQQAAESYRAALAIRPDFADAHNGLGVCAEMLGQHEAAIAHYRQSLAIQPRRGDVLNNLGNALINVLQPAAAAAALEQAIDAQPGLASAHNNLGRALKDLGRLEAARAAIERAITLDPRRPQFYRCLADLKRFTPTDPHLAAMETLAAETTAMTTTNRIDLHFALAKACVDTGQHERSFRHLLDGNKLKRAEVVYDEAASLRFFERIRHTFTPALMRDKTGVGDPSTVPIFILGMARSGTTLVEQILASHPSVFGAGELAAFNNTAMRLGKSNAVRQEYPEMVPHLNGAQLRSLGADYVATIQANAPTAKCVTDKLPANFLLLGLINLALPNARIIHTTRDPLDTCLSCFANLFAAQAFTYDLGELGRYYRGYQGLMKHWHDVMPAGVILDVEYEQVVADLEGQARRIVAHCGLEWDPACLTFHQTQRPVTTVSAVQVRQPIYRSAVGRVKPYLHLLQPLIDALAGNPSPA